MKERIVRYTSEEMDELAKHSLTDWDRVLNMKDEDIDFSDIPELDEEWFKEAKHVDFEKRYQEAMARKAAGRPVQKEHLKKVMIRLDHKTLDKLKTLGRGWSGKVRNIIQEWVSKTLL